MAVAEAAGDALETSFAPTVAALMIVRLTAQATSAGVTAVAVAVVVAIGMRAAPTVAVSQTAHLIAAVRSAETMAVAEAAGDAAREPGAKTATACPRLCGLIPRRALRG